MYIILPVPVAMLGALALQLVRGIPNDVFGQVGLVMLVGLASKNAILIVELAEQLREQGKSPIDAARAFERGLSRGQHEGRGYEAEAHHLPSVLLFCLLVVLHVGVQPVEALAPEPLEPAAWHGPSGRSQAGPS